MEKVRLIGEHFYKNEENREAWHRAEKRTGLTGDIPLIDSAAKWSSSFFMLERIIKSRKLITQYMEVCPDPCDLPSDEEWSVLKSIYFMLSDLHGCLQAMQGDDKRLAHYFPVTHTLRERLAKRGSYVCQRYIEELDSAEERHLGKGPCHGLSPEITASHPGRVWKSVKDLMLTASLAHPRYRQGLFLPEDQREKITTRMGSHCYSVWKKIHGVVLEDALADEDQEDEEEDELHDDLGAFGADEQLEVMCDELHDDLGGFMDDYIASVCVCC